MPNKKSFIIYENYGAMLNELPPETAGKIVQIMYRYQCGVDEAELREYDAASYAIFLSMKAQMDNDNAKYQAKCEAGRSGGDAKAKNAKAKSSKPVAKPSKRLANGSNGVAKPSQKEKEKENQKEKEAPTEPNNPPLSPLAGGQRTAKPAQSEVYSPDPALDDAVHEFIKHRKAMRKPMTDKAIELFMGKLSKLAPGDNDKQIRLINTAIERGWQTVYENDNNKVRGSTTTRSAQTEALAKIYQGLA